MKYILIECTVPAVTSVSLSFIQLAKVLLILFTFIEYIDLYDAL